MLVRAQDGGLDNGEYGGGGSLVKDRAFWYWGGDDGDGGKDLRG